METQEVHKMLVFNTAVVQLLDQEDFSRLTFKCYINNCSVFFSDLHFNQIKRFTKQEISCLYCILWYETSNK